MSRFLFLFMEYRAGFSDRTGREYYYVGAIMAEKFEAAFGREGMVCIIPLTPEQYVLAYIAQKTIRRVSSVWRRRPPLTF
jgi:hypothetical protein